MGDESRADDGRVDLIMGVVRGRYGERLSEAQLGEVREGVEAIVKASDAMRGVELDNGDIPFVARPYRGD